MGGSFTSTELDQEIMRLTKRLDDIESSAMCAILTAMAAGADSKMALQAGNQILIAADRKPIPLDMADPFSSQ